MKKRFLANLNSIDYVRDFVHLTGNLKCDIDVRSGRYVVDGKSILALFSIDLSQPVEVLAEGDEMELLQLESLGQKFWVTGEDA